MKAKLICCFILFWFMTATPVSVAAQTVVPPTANNHLRFFQKQSSSAKKIERRIIQAPKPIQAKGLENVYQISPVLYRGAQPTEEGYKTLARMGIKAVISLRVTPPDRDFITSLGIKSYHIPINPLYFSDKHVREFLNIIKYEKGPIYVHCLYGSDRTGAMVAIYRLIFQNWSRQEVLEEMKDKRFGFHEVFANLPRYIAHVDLQRIFPLKKSTPYYKDVILQYSA